MATELNKDDERDIRLAIEELNSAFAYHLDHGDIDALVALFTVDALYTNGDRRSQGRDEITALFRKRIANGPRTSRHLYSGLRIVIESKTSASGVSVCMSFAADGLPPLPAKPFLVADFVDSYRQDGDGRWRIATRHINPVFVGQDP
jgi:ketosteroid isomerase-like protein